MQEETELQVRTDGDPANPALIYLPGLHGDWTLLAAFRELAKKNFFLVQFTYPRTRSWTLHDYAAAVSEAAAGLGITHGWVLAESFSSLVAWAWLKKERENGASFRFDGVILAGGFVRYQKRLRLAATRFLFNIAPWFVWKALFWVYVRYSRFRHRNAPGGASSAREFITRRTPLDIEAMRARLRLIAEADSRSIAAEAKCPVYFLAGAIDPIVPPRAVIRWLSENCAALKDHRIIWPADHTVLATEPAKALEQIEKWVLRP